MKQTLTQDTERQPNQRTPSQLQHTSTARVSFEDRRESTTPLRQMQAAMDHSPHAIAQRQRSAQFHNSPRMVAQRQQMAVITGEPLQKMVDEEELIQGKFESKAMQRVEDEDELRQGKFESAQRKPAPAKQSNNTGLPDNFKSGIENLSGMSMDAVKVHYNSDKPAQLNAHAYAQGTDIHLAPGQEQHLPHEAWHVVQKAQGRVRPTMQMAGQQVNVDQRLEAEADVMGERAVAGGVVQARGELGGSIDLTGALSDDYVRRTSRLGSTQTAQLASWQPEETEPDATHYWDEQMDGVCWYSNGEVFWFHVVKQGSEDYSALDGVKKTWQEWHDLRQKSHPEEYPDLVPSTHGKQSEAIEEVVTETTDHEDNILEDWTSIAKSVGGPEGYEFPGNVRKTNFVMGPHKQSPAFALNTSDKFMAKFNKAEIGDILINHEHLTTLNGLLLMAKRGLMAHEAGHVKFNSANHPRALYEHEHVSAVGSLENTTELKKYLSMKTGGITNYELVMKQCSDKEYKEFIRMKYD